MVVAMAVAVLSLAVTRRRRILILVIDFDQNLVEIALRETRLDVTRLLVLVMGCLISLVGVVVI